MNPLKLSILSVACLALIGSVGLSQEARQQFDVEIETWRETILQTRAAGMRYFQSERVDSSQLKKEFDDLSKKADQHLNETIVPLALQAFDEQSEADPVLDNFIARIQEDFYIQGRFEKSYQLGKRILAREPNHALAGLMTAGAAAMTNRFDEASDYAAKNPKMIDRMGEVEKPIFQNLSQLQSDFQRETEIRQAESEADDLPRVEIRTTKGTIVVELFENEAPDTVGNFISLVEAKFYDETIFHRVLYQFMAQGGGFTMNKQKKLRYKIYDEHNKSDYRRHFRGVLSMAKTPAPDSGSSEFFITTVPTPHLDGQHTVFGRVIEGMDAVDRFTHTFRKATEEDEEPSGEIYIQGAVPDKILSAKVIRKRDREYKPRMVQR